jgi:cardiolipin synthase A/B
MSITARLGDILNRNSLVAAVRRAAKHRPRMLISTFLFLCHVAGFFTSIKAVMETRTAQGAIAWAVSLNTFPYVAVPAYWVFGRTKFSGYVIARRADLLKTNARARQLADDLAGERLQTDTERNDARILELLAKLPFTAHNHADLLIDGEATFAAIFDAIARAENYVLVQFYIIRDDALGRRLKEALIAKARAGVRCYVLFDEIGSGRLKNFSAELRAGGVRVAPFNSTKGEANRFQLNFRNHRKIVIVDGRCAFVGGHNVGDEYIGLDPEMSPWRDTHVKVEGPVVQCVQVSWVEDWHWATGEIPELQWKPMRAVDGRTGALCLASGPADRFETATLFFLHAINSAKKRLWLASPYFVPDEQFISALQLAALRGVDVRILIPEKPDNPLVKLSAYSYLPQTEPMGIKWFRHQRGFMHQKVMLVDDDYCAIGTANFDNRSFRLNFEITMVFDDTALAQQVVAMLEKDFADSRLAAARDLIDASFWFRLQVRVSRLFAPVQ